MKKAKRVIQRVIQDFVRSDFGKARILDIRITPDVDFDNSEILRIDVLFEGEPDDLDVTKTVSLVRRIRPKLEAIGETRFPLFSFISRRDLKAAKFEAA